MKGTESFKQAIKDSLDKRAKEDPLFAVSYAKPHKTIDKCIDYILNTVKKSGCSGFTDDEIFSMAVHYYDEDNIKDEKAPALSVVVNHHVELTEEEKAEARKRALESYEREYKFKLEQDQLEKQRKEEERKKARLEKLEKEPSLF